MSDHGIPAAGAADLSQFKGGDKSAQRKVANQILRQNGYLCSCGQLIKDEGVVVLGYNLGRFPEAVMTPMGPMQQMVDGVQTLTGTYHSRTCVDYLDAIKNGIPIPEGNPPGTPRPKVLAVRNMAPIEWLAPLP